MQGQNLLSGSGVWNIHTDMGTRRDGCPLLSSSWGFLWSLMLSAVGDEVLGCMGLSMLLLRKEGEQWEPGWSSGADGLWKTSAFFCNFFLSDFPCACKSGVRICSPIPSMLKNWRGQSWGKWEGNNPQGRLSSGHSMRHILHSLSQQPAATYLICNRQVPVNTEGRSVVFPQEHLRPVQKLRVGNTETRPGEIISSRYQAWTSLKIKIALRGNNNWTLPPLSVCLTLGQHLWYNCFFPLSPSFAFI